MKRDLAYIAFVAAVVLGPFGVAGGTFMAMWIGSAHPHKAEKWPKKLALEFAASQCRVAMKCPLPLTSIK